MEEQFPKLTLWRKWERVAPQVAYSGCCDTYSDSWFRTEAFILLAAGSVAADNFQQISLRDLPLATECHIFQITLLPRAKVQLNYQLRLWSWYIQFHFPLCAVFLPLLPHRCWSWGDTPVHFLHAYFHPSVCLLDKGIFLKKMYFIYLFLERREERKKEEEKNIHWLALTHPQSGTWPTTQEWALTGKWTSDLLVLRSVLNPLSHSSQG